MTQYAFDIDGADSGDDLVAALDDWRDAIQSSHKGGTAPAYAAQGLFWLDDSVTNKWRLKGYDGTDWITVLEFDPANNIAYAPYVPPLQRYPLAGGSADALTLTPNFPLAAYDDMEVVTIEAASDNTGAATLNISGVGAKAIRKMVGGSDVALVAKDLVDGQRYRLNYDTAANSAAGAWILENPSSQTPGVLLTTRGDIIVRGASIPGRLALGAAGAVPTSDGTDLAYEQPDVRLLTGGNFSGGNIDIVLTSYLAAGFTRFRLQFKAWAPATDNAVLYVRVSSNAGSSFVSSGYATVQLVASGTAVNSGSQTAAFQISTATGNAGGAEASSGHCEFWSDANRAHMTAHCHSVDGTPANLLATSSGQGGTGNVDAIRLLPSTGNHAGGSYLLYGIREN